MWRWAHPRVCGENGCTRGIVTSFGGSSPRVRGKPSRLGRLTRRAGLIPACAGKTRTGRRAHDPPQAHPRVCGENVLMRETIHLVTGSSPRVRGKQRSLDGGQTWEGLIPACAGKTRRKRMPERMHRAHPRVCGENDNQHQNSSVEVGSSPRVRGKLLGHSSPETTLGLIPACAGKTTRVVPTVPSVRAHPRVCGENDLLLSDHSRGDGSSPRVRGKRDNPRSRSSLRRLIPACAGKTGHRYRIGRYDTAHPRVCGENRHRLISAIPRRGSSPRVRGKRRDVLPSDVRGRLIPACAGKTQLRSRA